MTKDLGTALTAAVNRMAENRANGVGSNLTTLHGGRPVVELQFDAADQPILPQMPALPAASDDLHRALRLAVPTEAPPPVRDEDGGIVWVAPKPITIGIPAEIRAQAAERGRFIDMVLQPAAHPDLIGEWLLLWAQQCGRRKDQDFSGWQQAVLRAVAELPAVVFSDETAAMASQRFEFLPTPASLHGMLVGYLTPLREAADAARRVAAAPDPAPLARERPASSPLTDAEMEERRAFAAERVAKLKRDMAEITAERRRHQNKNPAKADDASYHDPYHLAVSLRQSIAMGGNESLVAASRTRLNALLAIHPHVAELLDAEREQVSA